jgi:hypothetical protein
MLLHHCIILWIFRSIWNQPHYLKTPVIGRMASWCSCDLRFESNSRIHRNLPAHTVFSPIRLEQIKNPKTRWTVGELPITWRCRFGW